MHLPIKHSLSLASVLFFTACSTVPDKAPEEFHLANSAIKDANNADVDEILPQTVDRAEATFDDALALYKKSEDNDLDRAAQEKIRQEATAKAAEARALAVQARELDSQVKAWDNKIEDHQAYTQMTQELQSLRQRLAAANSAQQENSAKTAAIPMNIKGPVAFFGMGETQVKGRFTESLASLSQVLKSDPKVQVKLVGYTDPKGDAARNREISRARAESVANILKSMGVAENQIVIDAAGADLSVRSKSPGDLQLARRVEASIVSGSTEMSSR